MADDLPDVFADAGWEPIFDGRSLDGWRSVPRVYGTMQPGGPPAAEWFAEHGVDLPDAPERHPAAWAVEDGAIVGRQGTRGYGGYLVSERAFGDFDLRLEMRPDWPADTGVMLRRAMDDWAGFQVLVDHRRSGGIGGFYGNGLAGFHATPFAVDAVLDAHGDAVGLRADDPATSVEPVTPEKRAFLRYAADAQDLLDVWRWGGWNELRVRCVGGALPVITTWIDGVRIAELDTATIGSPGFDPAAVAAQLGPRGHLAFEVHDNDPLLGDARWGVGAACRWRGVRIREHPQG